MLGGSEKHNQPMYSQTKSECASVLTHLHMALIEDTSGEQLSYELFGRAGQNTFTLLEAKGDELESWVHLLWIFTIYKWC